MGSPLPAVLVYSAAPATSPALVVVIALAVALVHLLLIRWRLREIADDLRAG